MQTCVNNISQIIFFRSCRFHQHAQTQTICCHEVAAKERQQLQQRPALKLACRVTIAPVAMCIEMSITVLRWIRAVFSCGRWSINWLALHPDRNLPTIRAKRQDKLSRYRRAWRRGCGMSTIRRTVRRIFEYSNTGPSLVMRKMTYIHDILATQSVGRDRTIICPVISLFCRQISGCCNGPPGINCSLCIIVSLESATLFHDCCQHYYRERA